MCYPRRLNILAQYYSKAAAKAVGRTHTHAHRDTGSETFTVVPLRVTKIC